MKLVKNVSLWQLRKELYHWISVNILTNFLQGKSADNFLTVKQRLGPIYMCTPIFDIGISLSSKCWNYRFDSLTDIKHIPRFIVIIKRPYLKATGNRYHLMKMAIVCKWHSPYVSIFMVLAGNAFCLYLQLKNKKHIYLHVYWHELRFLPLTRKQLYNFTYNFLFLCARILFKIRFVS